LTTVYRTLHLLAEAGVLHASDALESAPTGGARRARTSI